VSKHGGFATVHTVRRLTAKNAEQKQFRTDTVAPIYDALAAEYGESTPPTPCGFNFAGFDRGKYESLIISLRDSNDKLRKQVDEQFHKIEKQRKMIEILWHGLQADNSEEIQAVIKYYMKNIKE
jgi:hypothetical protein